MQQFRLQSFRFRVTCVRVAQAVVSFAMIAGALSCGSDFDSQMTLSGYRVIGIEASPPEVSPDDALQVAVHEYYMGSRSISYQWSLCLHSLGANVAYECSDPELETIVGDDRELALDLGPDGLNLSERLAALPPFPEEDGEARDLKRGFDLWLKLRSGPDCSGCESIESVKRLTARKNADEAPNQNPVILSFGAQGAVKRAQTVTLRVATDRPEPFLDPSLHSARREEYLYTWYTNEGEADPTRTFGERQETQLKLPEEPGDVEVVVAVRDGRGGLAVSRQTLHVE